MLASLSPLPGLSAPWFTIGLHNFQFSSPFNTSLPEKVEIRRSSIVCSSSTESDTGRSNTFNRSVYILEECANLSRNAYSQWNNSALFSKQFVKQKPFLPSFSAIGAIPEFLDLDRSELSSVKVAAMQSMLLRYFTVATVKKALVWWSFGAMYSCKYANADVKCSSNFLLP